MTNIQTVGFLFSENMLDVLLIEKQRPEWQKGKFNGIGGRMEVGESPVGCLVREFREETGVLLDKDSWTQFHMQRQMQSGASLYFYYAVRPIDVLHAARDVTDEKLQIVRTNVVLSAFTRPEDHYTKNYYVYNLGYLLLMALAYEQYPDHRYFEG